MKWQLINPEALQTRTWDNETVVYEATSGNTHLLDTTAASVLAMLANAPADSATIAQTLSDLWHEAPAALVYEQVDAMLAELAGISLIAPVIP